MENAVELSDDGKLVQGKALAYIEAHKDELIEAFITSKKPLKMALFAFFMAGSPGAGKTEFARRYVPVKIEGADRDLVKIFEKQGVSLDDVSQLLIHIDVDEVREFLPQYQKTDIAIGQKGNAHVIQKAANKGLDILRNHCLKQGISFLHDGTFSNYETLKKLIKTSLAGGRSVQIYYIYLDPLVAWEFTKAREYLEGRNIVKEKFIDQFFSSRENVDKIKEIFGEKVQLQCILKDSNNAVSRTEINQASVAKFLETEYSKGTLRRYSREELPGLLN